MWLHLCAEPRKKKKGFLRLANGSLSQNTQMLV